MVTLLAVTSTAQEAPPAKIEPVLPWTNVFAGKDTDTPRQVEFPLAVRAPKGFQGRLSWTFTINRATIQAQDVAVPGDAARISLGLRVPYVREGLVLKGKLRADLVADSTQRAVAHFEQPLWIFPPQPFELQGTRWKDRRIFLMDPAGKTAAILKHMAIPFEEVVNVTALDEIKEGLIVVGEGISLHEERALMEMLIKTAARGLPVLCLAPLNGTFLLPGTENCPPPRPLGLSLKGVEAIAEVSKHLDTRGWLPDGKVVASSLLLKSVEGNVVAEASAGPGGWPWLEVRYPSDGRLLVCGFGIISHWNASPTPRYLFAGLLERLTTRSKIASGQ